MRTTGPSSVMATVCSTWAARLPSVRVPVETLRKIETGRIATPAFFTVAALAASVGLSLEDVVASCAGRPAATPRSAA